MYRVLAIATVLLLALAPSSFADRSLGEIYKECGLGGMIGEAVGGGAGPVLAISTNITWDLGTTASASDISSPETCSGGQAKSAMYIYESYDYIAANLAEGGGDYVISLLQVSGCDTAIHTPATADLRKQFATMASEEGYAQSTRIEKAERFFDTYVNTLSDGYAGKCKVS